MAKFNLRNFFSLGTPNTGTTVDLKNTARAEKLKSGVRVRPLFVGNSKNKHSDKFWKAYGVSTQLEDATTVAGSAGTTYSSSTVFTSVKGSRRTSNSMKLGGSAQH